jgi:hypothetical protein
LHEAVKEGAVHRIRPKIMTVCAILFGLMPIMWSPVTQAGADAMKRIAAPMIGGVVTSAGLELLIYPVIFFLWKRRGLETVDEDEGPLLPGPVVSLTKPKMRKRVAATAIAVVLLAAAIYGGGFLWHKLRSGGAGEIPAPPFATQTVSGLTINLIAAQGALHQGDNDMLIEFRNSTGQLVDAGKVKFETNMNMASMVMHSGATIERTATPGRYRAQINLGMAGDWNATLSFDGPAGKGETNFSITAK